MEYWVDLLLLSFVLVFLQFWWKYTQMAATKVSHKKNLPPGPPGWPVVGNLFQVIQQQRPFIYVVRDLREKYGPIFTMKMGQRTLVIITSSELIHEALVQKGPVFASRPPDSPIRLVFSVGKCAINSSEYGSLWRTLRRNFVSEIINPAKIKQCSWIRKWALENHMNRLKKEADAKGFVEVMNNCRLTICGILVCLCFGERISEDRIKNIEGILKEIMLMTAPKLPDFLPVLSPLFSRQMKEAKGLRHRQMESLVPLIRKRRAFVEAGENSNSEMSPVGAAYIDSLLNMKLANNRQLGEQEFVTLCSEVISAGTDTSATAVEWALLHLVENQEIQEKLYQEIRACVGEEGSLVTEEDVEQMQYLGAVIKETFRRHPPSHFVLSHSVTRETELGGYTIPVDVYVEFYTAWVTKDPGLWKDPSQFRPERFLDGDGVDVDVTGTRGVKMLPFGAGRRICPAWNLGVLHVSLLLARMLLAYKWLPVPGNPPDPAETFAFTVVMKNPLVAVIVPRSS